MARESRGRQARREKYFRTEFSSLSGISNQLGGWWPQREGDHSVRALCPRCSRLFEIPSGLVMWLDMSWVRDEEVLAQMARERPDIDLEHLTARERIAAWVDEIEWRAGPCPRCWAEQVEVYGKPLLWVAESQDHELRFVVAGEPGTLIASMLELVDELQRGALTVVEVVDRLEKSGGALRRLGEWIEAHPATAQSVATLLAGVLAMGPQIVFRDDREDAPVINIINQLDDDSDDKTPAPTRRRDDDSYPRRHFSRDPDKTMLEDPSEFSWSMMGPPADR